MKLIIDDEDIRPLPIRLPMPTVDEEGDLIVPGVVEKPNDRTRGKDLTQLEREFIAHDVSNGIPQTSVARLHGVSQPLVSSLSQGYNTTGIDNRKINAGVLEVVQSSRERIANEATEKLLASLETFIPQTLDQKDLPSAALKLASVIEKVQTGFTPSGTGPRFIVFSPRMKAEEAFDIIEVHE